MRIVTPQEWRAQPWRNGGGVTHEIARWPAAGAEAAYDVRVSLAEVARPGPFSRFAGFRRWSFLAGDAPIELATRAGTHRLARRGDHVELPGEEALEAALPAGPTHLLNVLAREGVPIVVGHGPAAHPVRWIFALAATQRLARWHAIAFDPPEPAAEPDTIWIA